ASRGRFEYRSRGPSSRESPLVGYPRTRPGSPDAACPESRPTPALVAAAGLFPTPRPTAAPPPAPESPLAPPPVPERGCYDSSPCAASARRPAAPTPPAPRECSSRGKLLPVEPLVRCRQPMRRRILVARRTHLLDPLAERQQQLPVDQVRHVHGPVRQVVFHVVHLMPESSSVRLRRPRQPRLLPRLNRVRERPVSRIPDHPRLSQRLVDRPDRLPGLILRRLLQQCVDARDSLEHFQILAIKLSNREKNLDAVGVPVRPWQILP